MGDTAPVESRTAYTLDTLLAVSVAVFNERGYDGTSMEDLARAAAISKSSFYHHVSGKEELLRLAIDRALNSLDAVLAAPGACTGPAVRRLRHVVRGTVEALVEELPYVTLLLRVRGNTDTERQALQRRREFDRRVTALVQQAVEQGDLRDDLDVALTTRLLFGMINSVSEWYRPGGAAPHDPAGTRADTVASTVLAVALDGLVPR